MVDIENEIYTEVETAIHTAFPSVNVSSTPQWIPPAFPFVSFLQTSQSANRKLIDSSGCKFFNVTFTATIFSNLRDRQKSQCKEIENTIDDKMEQLGFTKSSAEHTASNVPFTYAMTVRYTAIVDASKRIYRG